MLPIGLHAACELIVDVTASKPGIGGGMVVSAAAFFCAPGFAIIDRINERLGKPGARRVVARVFVANLLLGGCAQFTIGLPAARFYSDGVAFVGVLAVWPLARGQHAVKMGIAAISLPPVFAVREA